MAMKVLTVLAGAAVGGAETFFVSLTQAFARTGLGVRSVIKPNPLRESQLKAAGIGYDTAPFRARFDLSTPAVMRRAAKAFQPDIVLAFAGRAAQKAPPGRHVLIGRLGGYYSLKYFRRCDQLVCNTPDLVGYVVKGGWPRANVHHISNFPSLADMPALDRSQLDTPNDVPLALALGRLHRVKGLDVLLKAAAQLPDLHIWVAGEGPERENLTRLADDLGIRSRVRFLGWRSDRVALYRAADVCVYPSREEPFGNVVVEAWSAGTPVVATASKGPAWLARNGEDAILVPIDDVAALAEGIRQILRSKTLADRLVSAGLRRVAGEFSEAAIVRRYIDLFESVRR